MILEGPYDDDQLWFPFMAGTIVKEAARQTTKQATTLTKQKQNDSKAFERARNEPFMDIPDQCREMHDLNDLDQCVISFLGHLRIGEMIFQRMLKASIFRRDENQKLATFRFNPNEYEELIAWCSENCSAFYHITNQRATFVSRKDATAAMLVFHPGQN